MMGMPIDHMKLGGFGNRATRLHSFIVKKTAGWLVLFVFLFRNILSKALMKLAGNSMHMRSILAALSIIFKAFHIQRLAEYLA